MTDIWTKLRSVEKPIVMYGMGDGADKILKVFNRYGITVMDFFASDGFVRGHEFHGKRVLSFAEICDKYKDFIIILSFATSIPEVLERIYSLSEGYELYAPSVPVAGDLLFDSEYYNVHYEELEHSKSLLEDDESKKLFDNIISYRLTGEIKYLKCKQCGGKAAFKTLLHPDMYHSCADLGAYNGDSIHELLPYAVNLSEIYAFEPDARNYKKLKAYLETIDNKRVEAYNIGAWSRKESLAFDGRGGRNSKFGEGRGLAEVDSLDNVLDGKGIDYIKYDVEGAEYEALLGSERTIREYKPEMLVSLYHRSEDIYKLPLLLKKFYGGFKFYLRKNPYIPDWDLNLYAISDKGQVNEW